MHLYRCSWCFLIFPALHNSQCVWGWLKRVIANYTSHDTFQCPQALHFCSIWAKVKYQCLETVVKQLIRTAKLKSAPSRGQQGGTCLFKRCQGCVTLLGVIITRDDLGHVWILVQIYVSMFTRKLSLYWATHLRLWHSLPYNHTMQGHHCPSATVVRLFLH